MKNALLLFLIILICRCGQTGENNIQLPAYPVAPSKAVSKVYFGTNIKDDYRNLEDLDDSLVLNWFKKEAEYAEGILNNIQGREALLKKLKNYDKRRANVIRSINVTEDNQYFFLKQGADEDVARIFYRKDFNSEDELIYDPKDFKPENGHSYVVNYINPCWDGSLLAIALTYDGLEISEMLIVDMNTRKVLPEVIDHCWPADGGGISWLPDNSGFIYLHYPEIDQKSNQFLKDMKSVLYKIGDNPKDLKILFSRETHPELNILPEDFPVVTIHSKEDKYLHGEVSGATAYIDGYYAKIEDLSKEKLLWEPLYKKEDKVGKGVFMGDNFVFSSAKNSPNFQILESSITNLDVGKSSILVNERLDEVIGDFQFTSEGLYYSTTKNGVEAKLYKQEDGKQLEITLPQVSGFVNISTKGTSSPDIWVSTMGWLNDFIRYKYDEASNQFKEENLSPNANYPEFSDFIVKELVVPSHDGELVPLSIIHRKDIVLNSKNPTLLFGYGAYGFTIQPFFSPTWLSWVEEGGVLCLAHVRGGGAKGDTWYQAGKKTTKLNTWKDLIASTEYMISEGYTSKNNTAIYSASAGGILIGRAMTERPDLFAAAITEVGMMNALRSEKTPNGPNNTKEFGTSEDSIECRALIEMDAYLHIKKETKYPATLITTGMNDPRVIAWQPGKFAAKLQALNSSDKPIVFQVDYESGHGIGDKKSKYFENMAAVFSFAFWQTGHSGYKFKKSSEIADKQ